MTTPPTNDAAPRGGGAGVNDPKSQANHSANGPPIPDGITREAWLLLAQPEDDRWVIRERDASGEVTGTAYRDASGAKTFAPGGKRGLIVAWPLDDDAGTNDRDPVLICEGASDTAALLGLGLDAVGVPMAGHCGQMLAELLANRHAAIVADADEAGRRGAEKVAAALLPRCASVRIIEPPNGAKDARAAVIGGADRAAFMALALRAERIKSKPEATAVRSRPTIAPYRPFPTNALPEALRRFVEGTSAQMGVDSVFLISPALAVLASAAGNAVRVMIRKGWYEPLAVWTGIIALPSSMKSPAQDTAMRAVYEAQRELDENYDAALGEYEANCAEYEASKPKRGGQRPADAPAKPTKPPRRQAIVGNATPEALAHVLAANPRGVLCEHDELAGLFGSFGAYSKAGANRAEPHAAFFKSAWSGRTYIENRKGDGGSYIRIDSPLLSLTGTIQPGPLRRILGSQYIEDGLASRFLWAMPPDDPARIIDEREDEEDFGADFRAVYRRLLSLPMKMAGTAPDPLYVGLQRDAFRLGRAWWNDTMRPRVAEASPALRAAQGKLKGYVFRLALLFHLVDWAESGGSDSPGPVGAELMRHAIVVAEWYVHELGRVYGMLAEEPEERERRELAEWIRRHGGTATPRDLMRNGPYFKRADDAEAALCDLVAAGYGRWGPVDDHGGGRGRPARRFRLFEATDTDTNAKSQAKHPTCVSVSEPADLQRAGPTPADANDLGAGCSDFTEEGGTA